MQRFPDQFKNVMILILPGAAVISFVVACSSGETSEFFEPLLIVGIVIDAAQSVAGDIISLEAGDFVQADARLIHSASVKSEVCSAYKGFFAYADPRLEPLARAISARR